MQKTPYVFPIIGGRKVEQLEANIEALDVALSEEQIKYLEGILPFDPGFPTTMIVSSYAARLCRMRNSSRDAYDQGDGTEYNRMFVSAGNFDKWPRAQAIRPTGR